MKKHLVRLTDEQALLLRSVDNDGIQAAVALARARLDAEARGNGRFAGEVRLWAETRGRLGFRQIRINSCNLCGKSAGYAKYPRNTKYHNRGDSNLNKPLTMAGVDLAIVFVSVKNRATLGCCLQCWESGLDGIRSELKGVRAEMPEAVTGHPSAWAYHPVQRCLRCGWEGGEHLMGRLPVLMGPGSYPGVCPECEAKSRPLCGGVFESAGGFVLVPA